MPRFIVTTTAQVRREYTVMADSADEAEEIVANTSSEHLSGEEDIGEEIDDVKLSHDQE